MFKAFYWYSLFVFPRSAVLQRMAEFFSQQSGCFRCLVTLHEVPQMKQSFAKLNEDMVLKKNYISIEENNRGRHTHTRARARTHTHSHTQKCHNCKTNAVEDEVFQYVKFRKQRLECFKEIRKNEEVISTKIVCST